MILQCIFSCVHCGTWCVGWWGDTYDCWNNNDCLLLLYKGLSMILKCFFSVASTAVLGVLAGGVILLVILMAAGITVIICYWKNKRFKYKVWLFFTNPLRNGNS